MKGPALKQLLLALSEIKNSDSLPLSLTSSAELKPQQMMTILQRLLGDSVHVINPALSVQASPLAMGPAQAAGLVQYLQALRPWTPLKKPVVMLVAQPQTEQKSRSSGVTVNAWRTMVIVPQNYQPSEGKSVGNDQNPLMYYFDPQKQLALNQAPAEVMGFCQVLIRGCQVPAMHQGRAVQIRVEPVFRQLGFFHGCRDLCREPADSSWWALYFAIMAVSYGGVSFEETDRLSLSRLQTVLGSVLTEPAPSLETSPVTSTASSGAMTTSSTSDISSDIKTPVQSPPHSSTSPSLESSEPTADPEEVKPKKQIPSRQKEAEKIDENKGSAPSPISQTALPETSVPSVPKEKQQDVPEYKYSGPTYTTAIMAGILRAYQIASTAEDKLSRDSSGGFELTAYPQAPLTETVFLKALLHYWQARQGLIDNWRAAFLFSTQNTQTGQSQTVAVMIQYAAPNTALASQLWQEQKAARTSPRRNYSTPSRSPRPASKLYGQVQVMVLGVAAQPSLVNSLKGSLEKVCRGQVALNFKAISQMAAYSVVLMEDVLGMLQHGQTREIEPGKVTESHRERCVQAIIDRWRQTEHHNVPLHQELLAALRTVLIMSTLQIKRQSNYQQSGEDKLSPRTIQARDQAMKKHLYAQRFPDPQALIEGLPLAVLASFLVTVEVTENLKVLNQHQDQLRLEILQWKLTLQEDIRQNRQTACDYMTRAWHFVYYSSFLGVGGELGRLLGRSLSGEGSREEKDHKTEQDLAAQEARLVGRIVQAITRSESLSTRSETMVRLYLGTEPVSRSLGFLGTCLGAGVQIYLGPYALWQMLGMSAITLTGYRKVEADRLDDFKAELKEPLCSLTALHRLSVLLWHSGEALAQGSLVPIILAAGGMMGSESLTLITRRILPQEDKEAKSQIKRTTAEGPELSTLLIRQVGTLLGQRGAAMVWITAVGIQHRILYRDTAVALLSHGAANHPGLSEWKIEGADFRRPGLWFNGHNPLMLSWITPSGAQRQAICEIKGLPILTPAGITGLDCQGDMPTTELSVTLQLPRP